MRRPGLYVQVLIAIALGVALGAFAPTLAVKMQPLGDGFIKLIRMLIAPIIFCTVVTGVGNMGDMRQAGRIGIKALLYFIAMSAVSLLLGLLIANLLKPGAGLVVTFTTDPNRPLGLPPESFVGFLFNIIPPTLVGAFAIGTILQVLFVALLVAFAVMAAGERAANFKRLIEETGHVLFTIIGFVMKLAPLGAFGAMAFTIGHYGIGALLPLAKLLACFYFTCLLFVFLLLGGVLRSSGLNIFRFVAYLKDEIFIVFGTSSSETVLPRLLDKLSALGCARPVVGMVLPTGYSFNLDGTAIYLTLAAVFLAQATGTPMGWHDQLLLLLVMMISSKGAAGVTGAGFAVLAGSLASVGHIPTASLALILGVDRFMSEGRAITNLIGNGVATVVLAKWENALDLKKAQAILAGTRAAKLETD